MRDCEGQTIDDYPCTELAVVKIGTKYYCEDHAHELEDGYPDLYDEGEYDILTEGVYNDKANEANQTESTKEAQS